MLEEFNKDEQDVATHERNKEISDEIGASVIIWHLKQVADRARYCLSHWTPLSWERQRRKALRKHTIWKPNPLLDNNQTLNAIGNSTWSILWKMPWDTLALVIEEIDCLAKEYENFHTGSLNRLKYVM